jgi:hypothetical protein
MDRFSDFSATRGIAEISVHYHIIRGGVGGGTAKRIYYIEENANFVVVGTDISFKICCSR